jgi:hypothetical protein
MLFDELRRIWQGDVTPIAPVAVVAILFASAIHALPKASSCGGHNVRPDPHVGQRLPELEPLIQRTLAGHTTSEALIVLASACDLENDLLLELSPYAGTLPIAILIGGTPSPGFSTRLPEQVDVLLLNNMSPTERSGWRSLNPRFLPRVFLMSANGTIRSLQENPSISLAAVLERRAGSPARNPL